MSDGGRLRRLLALPVNHLRTAWWGLARPRLVEREPLVVVQAVVLGDAGLLLALRNDLWGWELPGGHPEAGEAHEDALQREVREETGLTVEPERLVGEYVRTGFRPHTARVYRCRVLRGQPGASSEVAESRWFDPNQLPDTLFPWFRAPIADALADAGAAVQREEHQGVGWIVAGFRIDLQMRWRGGARR